MNKENKPFNINNLLLYSIKLTITLYAKSWFKLTTDFKMVTKNLQRKVKTKDELL